MSSALEIVVDGKTWRFGTLRIGDLRQMEDVACDAHMREVRRGATGFVRRSSCGLGSPVFGSYPRSAAGICHALELAILVAQPSATIDEARRVVNAMPVQGVGVLAARVVYGRAPSSDLTTESEESFREYNAIDWPLIFWHLAEAFHWPPSAVNAMTFVELLAILNKGKPPLDDDEDTADYGKGPLYSQYTEPDQGDRLRRRGAVMSDRQYAAFLRLSPRDQCKIRDIEDDEQYLAWVATTLGPDERPEQDQPPLVPPGEIPARYKETPAQRMLRRRKALNDSQYKRLAGLDSRDQHKLETLDDERYEAWAVEVLGQ